MNHLGCCKNGQTMMRGFWPGKMQMVTSHGRGPTPTRCTQRPIPSQKLRGTGFFGGFCAIFAGLDFGLITRLAQLVQVWRRLCARAMVELQYEFLGRADLFLVWSGTGRETEAKGRGANESDEQVFHDELLG
ncbi:hypothetical protein Ajs_2701 [Acidovorax sp. JS42]|nr:hypothetical protein Ajs_2701 [Acidovorax sp. JS42]